MARKTKPLHRHNDSTLVRIFVNVPAGQLRRVDEIAADLTEKHFKHTRSDVIRDYIARGLMLDSPLEVDKTKKVKITYRQPLQKARDWDLSFGPVSGAAGTTTVITAASRPARRCAARRSPGTK